MKAKKIITIITIILLVIIITLASFIGIYKKQEYKVSNIVPKYLLGMEFKDSRIIEFKVDNAVKSTTIYDKDGNEIKEKQEGIEYTEENGYKIVETKVNDDGILTENNYNVSKQILEKRLKSLGIDQYLVRKDSNNGTIQINIPESKNTQDVISILSQKGIFEIKDNETNEVLLNNSFIKNTKVVYGQTESGNTVYLQIKFNDEGKQKLQDISQKYISSTVQKENEEGKLEETSETKEVAIVFDGQTYRTTYFGETINDGTLNIALGLASDTETLNQYMETANQMQTILNSGILPISYNTSTYVISPSITNRDYNIITCSYLAVLLALFIHAILKLKAKGILIAILEIGYMSLLLLALRYTNIKITLEGVIGIIISILLNYTYIYYTFKNLDKNFVKDITGKFALKLIPIYIISVIFTFNNIANISSLGMTLVWGIITMYVYNLILTKIAAKTVK